MFIRVRLYVWERLPKAEETERGRSFRIRFASVPRINSKNLAERATRREAAVSIEFQIDVYQRPGTSYAKVNILRRNRSHGDEEFVKSTTTFKLLCDSLSRDIVSALYFRLLPSSQCSVSTSFSQLVRSVSLFLSVYTYTYTCRSTCIFCRTELITAKLIQRLW